MMNQEEWVEHFEAFNGRKPSPEEYMAALKNEEFIRDSKKAPSSSVSQTSPVSKLLEASPMPSQAKQSFLGRLSKSAKIWIAVALIALIALGGYFFYQQHVNNIEGTWEIVKAERQRVGDTKKTVFKDAAGHIEIEGEKFDLISYSYNKKYDEYNHIEKMSKEFGYGTVDKKAKTIITPKSSEIKSFPYEIKDGHLYLVLQDKEDRGRIYLEAKRVSEARAKELKAKVEAELARQEKEESEAEKDYDDEDYDEDEEEEYN